MRKLKGRRAFTLIESVIVIGIIGILGALILAGVQKARSAADQAQCLNNLRQIGIALHQYHDFRGSLPPGVSHPDLLPGVSPLYGPPFDPYPLLNWQARILPFLEQDNLWKITQQAYLQDKYFINDPPHVGLITPLAVYICPADGPRDVPGTTSYLGVSGTNQFRRDGLFYIDSRVRFVEITDGMSNTLMVGERPATQDGVYGRWYGGWGYWGVANAFLGVREIDIDESVSGCYGPYHFSDGKLSDPCSRFHYWSFHSGGGNFLFADGSARFLSYAADIAMPALATRGGGEPIPDF